MAQVCWHIPGLTFLASVAGERMSSDSGHQTWSPTLGLGRSSSIVRSVTLCSHSPEEFTCLSLTTFCLQFRNLWSIRNKITKGGKMSFQTFMAFDRLRSTMQICLQLCFCPACHYSVFCDIAIMDMHCPRREGVLETTR